MISKATVFQSASSTRPCWVDQCLDSVQDWSARQGFQYRFVDDTLFDSIDPALRTKIAARKPILADLARLDLLTHHLATGHEAAVAIWVDADTLCLDPDWTPDFARTGEFGVGFGEECWVQQDSRNQWRRFFTPHNAFMIFTRESVVLPFLRQLAISIIRRADADHIAPQMVGPKLLKALHSLSSFGLFPEAGALSPALLREIEVGHGPAIACYRGGHRPPLKMVNLCASLVSDDDSVKRVQQVMADPNSLECLVR